jgi:hypothetical protein
VLFSPKVSPSKGGQSSEVEKKKSSFLRPHALRLAVSSELLDLLRWLGYKNETFDKDF